MSYASKLDFLRHKYKGLFFELEPSIERLEDRQFILNGPFADSALNDGLMRLNSKDIEYIQRQYTDSLWETMQILLPHYRTTKE